MQQIVLERSSTKTAAGVFVQLLDQGASKELCGIQAEHISS